MNLGEAKTKALQIMDEFSVNAQAISAADNTDYTARMNNFADSAQKEIAQFKKIHAVKKISQNRITNLIGDDGFELEQYLSDAIIYTGTGAKSYYFEVDGAGTVQIQEDISGTWTTLETVTPSVTTFTAYRGLITAGDTDNDIRLRFTGTYPYNIQNVALYAYTFASADDVPDFEREISYSMPNTFMDLKKVVERDKNGYIRDYGIYRWQSKTTLMLPYDFKGSVEVEYYAYPVTITPGTLADPSASDSTEFEIDTEAQELIPYYMAAHCFIVEQPEVYGTLLNIYLNKLSSLDTVDNQGVVTIVNTSGW
ncbi:MAG: hypothetical protein WD491_02555 [Balneolales bacterium]